jgi:hypothetical protein
MSFSVARQWTDRRIFRRYESLATFSPKRTHMGRFPIQGIASFLFAASRLVESGFAGCRGLFPPAVPNRTFAAALFSLYRPSRQGRSSPARSKAFHRARPTLFDEVQAVVNERWRYSPKEKQTRVPKAFMGLLRCSTCGCAITAEIQKGHTYYRCTKRNKTCQCFQPYVREEALDAQISSLLKQGFNPLDVVIALATFPNGFHRQCFTHRPRQLFHRPRGGLIAGDDPHGSWSHVTNCLRTACGAFPSAAAICAAVKDRIRPVVLVEGCIFN